MRVCMYMYMYISNLGNHSSIISESWRVVNSSTNKTLVSVFFPFFLYISLFCNNCSYVFQVQQQFDHENCTCSLRYLGVDLANSGKADAGRA